MTRVFLAALVLLGLPAALLADDAAKADQKKLQGTWAIVSVEINKQPIAMDMLKDARLTVKGTKYSFKLADTKLELTYKLFPDKTPKAIDLTVTEGAQKGKTLHGIYKLDGDFYTVCRNVEPGKDRPAEFVTKPDSGLMLIVWKRVKP
jgi:uncharacterized protein (TIGR03067 family)